MTRMVTNRPVAQGDLLIIPIKELPKGVLPLKLKNPEQIVCAHSETGHDHLLATRPTPTTAVEAFIPSNDEYGEIPADQATEANLMEMFLVVTGPDVAEIDHKRSWDTHESIGLTEGVYQLRRQRQYHPEGWRRAID